MQGLIERGCGNRSAVFIAALFGLVQAYGPVRGGAGAGVSLLAAGPLLGVCLLYLFAWLLRNFGRWFGAEAEVAHLRLALGWGLLPWLCSFALVAVCREGAAQTVDLAGLYPLFFAFFIYGYVVLLLCLQAALRITLVKTFLCLLVTALVSFFPLTLLAQLLLGPSSAV